MGSSGADALADTLDEPSVATYDERFRWELLL
jgi:hypothetical protein